MEGILLAMMSIFDFSSQSKIPFKIKGKSLLNQDFWSSNTLCKPQFVKLLI